MASKKQKPMPIVLQEDEVFAITGYKRAVDQKRHFDALGVPAIIRPDNTLSVVRAHLLSPPARLAQNDEPKRVRQVRRVA